MIKLLSGRQTGKTRELIKMSVENNTPIVVRDQEQVRIITMLAEEMGVDIPAPINVRTLLAGSMQNRFENKEIKSVLVDDADIILQILMDNLRVMSVDAIAMCTDDTADTLIVLGKEGAGENG